MGGEVLSCLRSLTYNYKVLPLTAEDQLLLCVGLTTGHRNSIWCSRSSGGSLPFFCGSSLPINTLFLSILSSSISQ